VSRARIIFHMARADFLERVRRRSFLATLGFTLYLGYMIYSGQITLRLDRYRGELNSAWIGSLVSLVASAFLSLVGFYVVKNCIERDDKTRVGAILAATPISNALYTVSKALSNFAVLGEMVLMLAASAVIIQLAQPSSTSYNFYALFLPTLVVGLSSLSVTAALAILFESIPVLRAAFGNVLYFFLWFVLMMMSVPVAGVSHETSVLVSLCDYSGSGTLSAQMQAQLRHLDPDFRGGTTLQVGVPDPSTKVFVWNGFEWSGPFLVSRALWVIIALGLSLLASLFFNRFDPARGSSLSGRRRFRSPPGAPARIGMVPPAAPQPLRIAIQAPHPQKTARRPLLGLMLAELRLLLLGRAWLWFAIAAALFVACLLVPLASARSVAVLLAWLWPIPLWSQLGTREAQFSTQALVFSAPAILPRQVIASWLAGVIVAAITGGGLGLRLLVVGDWPALSAWLVAALFIPAFSLSLGVLTNGPKAFEAIYVAWWYIGPLHHGRSLDFVGTTDSTTSPGLYLTVSIALVVFACVWRKLRMAYNG
jgi:hypothetical protein